jgi:hypothetical protein
MAWPRLILALLAGALLAGAEPAAELRVAGAQFTDRATADAALARVFTLQGVTATQPLRADGAGYDWEWRGPNNDPEWAWFFNRQQWLPALLASYRETGDARYLATLLADLDDWIATHPPPGRITFSPAWRPLEAARRLLHSWLPVGPALADLSGTNPEFRARFDASLTAHGEHLVAHHAFGGNHLITEMLALSRLGLERPDLPDADRWLAYGLAELKRAYEEQVYPDGAHAELSTHYQRVVTLNYQELLDRLRAADRENLVAEWAPRVARLWSYIAAVMTPSGANPQNNDSDREDYRGLLAAHAPELLKRDGGNPFARHLPWAGQTVWRGGPTVSEHWGFFSAGPRGTDHDHADHLQFDLSLGADDFLIDSGRYVYAPGRWRDYFAGPAGHNVLVIAGRGALPAPRQITAEPEPPQFRIEGDLSWAWGDAIFSTPGQARAADWRRLVVYLRDEGWVVLDRIVAFGSYEAVTQWHWAPALAVGPVGDRWTVRGPASSLIVAGPREGAWRVARGQESPAPRGWFSPYFNRKEPATQTDWVQGLRGPRVNVWIFQPEGGPVSLSAEFSATRCLVVRAGGREWHIDPEAPETMKIR